VAVVDVEDTLTALGDLAAYHRRRFRLPVVAVTGSAGKTTTKEFIAAVLGQRWNTLKAPESYNNEVGVPLSLLDLKESHGAVALEFAMRGGGQIGYLTRIARPTIGVITNVGESHLGLLGSVEAIARAKGELLELLQPDGLAVLNADDPWFSFLKGLSPARIATVGRHAAADYSAQDIRLSVSQTAEGSIAAVTQFTLASGTDNWPMRLPVCGRHFVSNALAAVAVGRWLGMEYEAIARGISAVELPKMRQQWLKSPRGFLILNDAYNSSPASLRAALDVLQSMTVTGRCLAVLGDIKELGEQSQAIHHQLGVELKSSGIAALICLGEFAEVLASGAREGGLDAGQIFRTGDTREAVDRSLSLARAGDVVLVKGSRAMRLEEVVEGLMS
jgi:UDP-N-acetylmuramoyl-tripeptide--D-alanyl-D-alanine ligase